MELLKNVLINFSINHCKLVLLMTVLMTLMTGAFFPLVTMDTDPENMLPANAPGRVLLGRCVA